MISPESPKTCWAFKAPKTLPNNHPHQQGIAEHQRCPACPGPERISKESWPSGVSKASPGIQSVRGFTDQSGHGFQGLSGCSKCIWQQKPCWDSKDPGRQRLEWASKASTTSKASLSDQSVQSPTGSPTHPGRPLLGLQNVQGFTGHPKIPGRGHTGRLKRQGGSTRSLTRHQNNPMRPKPRSERIVRVATGIRWVSRPSRASLVVQGPGCAKRLRESETPRASMFPQGVQGMQGVQGVAGCPKHRSHTKPLKASTADSFITRCHLGTQNFQSPQRHRLRHWASFGVAWSCVAWYCVV